MGVGEGVGGGREERSLFEGKSGEVSKQYVGGGLFVADIQVTRRVLCGVCMVQTAQKTFRNALEAAGAIWSLGCCD